MHSNDHAEGWTTVNYNDHFKGIPQKRSCTDVYCLAVLVAFVFCWVAVGYYAYHNGDISRLMAPKDSLGRTCGIDAGVREAKYLFFFEIYKCASLSVFIFGCPTKQICVKTCPTQTWRFSDVYGREKTQQWNMQVRDKLICDHSIRIDNVTNKTDLETVIKEGKCASEYFPSTSAFFNLCLPLLGHFTSERIATEIENEDKDKAKNYFSYAYTVTNLIREDFKKCWHFIVLFICASLLASLFVIIVMGIITRVVIWITLALILIFLLYSSIITYLQYDSMPEAGTYSTFRDDFYSETVYGQLQWLFQQRQTWLVLFIVSVTFFGLFLLLVIFLRSRIELAVMLIGEGSKAINKIKSTLCFPLVTRLLQLAIILWFLGIFFYVKSLGDTVYTVTGLNATNSNCVCRHYKENDWCLPERFREECRTLDGNECKQASCNFKEFRHPKLKYYFQLYNLFGLLWGLYFVSGLRRMVLSHSFATWYWTYNKYDIPFFTLIYSVLITCRYHLGTLALGSFLIATCGFIRTLLEHTQRMLKQSDGLLTQCLTWSMRCCFWCLQKFLIFLSNNAYIMSAILGTGFFSSAGEALGLLARNIVRVVVLDKVLDFLMLVGKLSVTLLMGCLSYFAFSHHTLNLHYPIVPTVIVIIVVWIISSSFFGVYEVAVDTLFLSFLKDSEINDGSQNKPYYMSHKLKYMLKENIKSRS